MGTVSRLALALLLPALPLPASAAGIVTIGPDVGPTWSVSSASDVDVMTGVVTVSYFDPTGVLPVPSEAVGFNAGVATSGIGLWQLSLIGPNTFELLDTGMAGVLAPVGIDRIFFSLLPFGGAWDRTNPNPGTPGSGAGGTFSLVSFGGSWDVHVTHSGDIALGALPSSGDLFGAIDINFINNLGAPPSPGVFDVGDSMVFTADTDSIFGVPEPARVALLLLVLSGLGARRARPSRAD